MRGISGWLKAGGGVDSMVHIIVKVISMVILVIAGFYLHRYLEDSKFVFYAKHPIIFGIILYAVGLSSVFVGHDVDSQLLFLIGAVLVVMGTAILLYRIFCIQPQKDQSGPTTTESPVRKHPTRSLLKYFGKKSRKDEAG